MIQQEINLHVKDTEVKQYGRQNKESMIYLNHENTRHYGSFRKMSWEEVIVYCHILDRNSIFSWFVINHSVNQKEWEPGMHIKETKHLTQTLMEFEYQHQVSSPPMGNLQMT